MKEDLVIITGESPYKDYRKNEMGILKGFMRSGDDVPCAVVRLGKRYVLVPIHSLEYKPDHEPTMAEIDIDEF
jgi:hypothetical protein